MTNRVFIAASLDGYIARRDGSLDWLTGIETPEGEDYGYAEFMKTIDAVVMGRKTYEAVLSFGEWPYVKPVFVLSRTLPRAPGGECAGVLAGEPAEIVKGLREKGYGNLYIDGGRTVREFMRAGFIDELTITVVPVLLGSGVPLFGDLPQGIALNNKETKTFPNGLVRITYAVERRGA
ncbi:MAG: dihydrofolate reductase [Spirochaetales bacterium]|nr:dihydrofolate reductase [Spirochaetales bacterium]